MHPFVAQACALSSNDTSLTNSSSVAMKQPFRRECRDAGVMHPGGSLEVNVRTLPSIMSDLGLAHVDIVKIDVEGSEFAFLSQVREIEPESRKIGQKRPKRGIICLLTLSWLSRLHAGAPALRRAGAAVPGRSAGSGGAPLHTKPAVRRSSLAGGGGALTAP